MKIEHIREFLRVAEMGNILSASILMSIDNSTCAKHIKVLETELGCSLLHRRSHSVSLTLDGEYYYLHFKKLINDYDNILMQRKNTSKCPYDHLSISMFFLFNNSIINELVMKFMDKYPTINIEIKFIGNHNHLFNLLNHTSDLAIETYIPASTADNIIYSKIGELELSIISQVSFDELDLSDIQNIIRSKQIICPNLNFHTGLKSHLKILEEEGYINNGQILEVQSIEDMLQTISTTDSYGFLPHLAITKLPANMFENRLQILPKLPLFAIRKKNDKNENLTKLLFFLRDELMIE